MELSTLERSSSLFSSRPQSQSHRRSPTTSPHSLISFIPNPNPNRGLPGTRRVWRSGGSVDLDRFRRVLSRGVKSKEDLKEQWDLDQGDEEDKEEGVFWQALDRLKDLRVKMDSDITYKVLVYGSGALAALLVTSAITSAIDSIPLLPKLLEVVGLGYTVWFSVRYLIFKENRDELFGKVEDLKSQIFGDEDD